MNFRSLAACLALTCTTTLASAENWERFRGPGGRGVAENQNLPVQLDDPKSLVWKVALPGLGNSSPVIWGDQLFVQAAKPDGSQRSLLCLDVRTGAKRWEHTYSGKK